MPTVQDITVRKATEQESVSCKNWPTWSCETSEFEWEYTQTEKCLIIDGSVEVRDMPPSGKSVSFGKGDYVELPTGLKCIWNVKQPVRKHYDFE
jgi:uncharacterized cupin superfamily protein